MILPEEWCWTSAGVSRNGAEDSGGVAENGTEEFPMIYTWLRSTSEDPERKSRPNDFNRFAYDVPSFRKRGRAGGGGRGLEAQHIHVTGTGKGLSTGSRYLGTSAELCYNQ